MLLPRARGRHACGEVQRGWAEPLEVPRSSSGVKLGQPLADRAALVGAWCRGHPLSMTPVRPQAACKSYPPPPPNPGQDIPSNSSTTLGKQTHAATTAPAGQNGLPLAQVSPVAVAKAPHVAHDKEGRWAGAGEIRPAPKATAVATTSRITGRDTSSPPTR
jgi:hypothetical protein